MQVKVGTAGRRGEGPHHAGDSQRSREQPPGGPLVKRHLVRHVLPSCMGGRAQSRRAQRGEPRGPRPEGARGSGCRTHLRDTHDTVRIPYMHDGGLTVCACTHLFPTVSAHATGVAASDTPLRDGILLRTCSLGS